MQFSEQKKKILGNINVLLGFDENGGSYYRKDPRLNEIRSMNDEIMQYFGVSKWSGYSIRYGLSNAVPATTVKNIYEAMGYTVVKNYDIYTVKR